MVCYVYTRLEPKTSLHQQQWLMVFSSYLDAETVQNRPIEDETEVIMWAWKR